MPRKQNTTSERYNDPFPRRLRELIEETDTTQQKIADQIGKTRQTVSNYADGSSEPDLKTLVAIANHFKVSVDYLLDNAPARSTNPDRQVAIEYTGLSEKAINKFHPEPNYTGLTGIKYTVARIFEPCYYTPPNMTPINHFLEALDITSLSDIMAKYEYTAQAEAMTDSIFNVVCEFLKEIGYKDQADLDLIGLDMTYLLIREIYASKVDENTRAALLCLADFWEEEADTSFKLEPRDFFEYRTNKLISYALHSVFERAHENAPQLFNTDELKSLVVQKYPKYKEDKPYYAYL